MKARAASVHRGAFAVVGLGWHSPEAGFAPDLWRLILGVPLKGVSLGTEPPEKEGAPEIRVVQEALADAGIRGDDPVLSRTKVFGEGGAVAVATAEALGLEGEYLGPSPFCALSQALLSLERHEIDLAVVVGESDAAFAAVALAREEESGVLRFSPYACLEVYAQGREGMGRDAMNGAHAALGLLPQAVCSLEILAGEKKLSLDVLGEVFGSHDPGGAMIALSLNTRFATLPLGGLIKAAFSLSSKALAAEEPLLSAESLAPFPFYNVFSPRPWVHDPRLGPRRAAILAPDLGSYLVLQERGGRKRLHDLPQETELFALFAQDPEKLQEKMAALEKASEKFPFADLSHTVLARLDFSLPARLCLVARDQDDLVKKLKEARGLMAENPVFFERPEGIYYRAQASSPLGKTVVLFPGQGFPGLMGHYAAHLHELCLRFDAVREPLDIADFRDIHPEDRVPLSYLFFPPPGRPKTEQERFRQRVASPMVADVERCKARLDRKVSMLALSVSNIMAWNFLKKLGLEADAVFGQSLGELSALVAAGAISYPEMVSLLREEPNFDTSYYGLGRMFAATGDAEKIRDIISSFQGVDFAVYVARDFHLLAGEKEAAEAAMAALRQAGMWVQSLPYPAIHTPEMAGLKEAGRALFTNLTVRKPLLPIYSGTTTDLYPTEEEAIRAQMMSNYDNPVRLWQTTLRMAEDGVRIFVQSGGGSTMHAQAKTNIGKENVVATSFDVEYRSPITQIQHLVGALLTSGNKLDMDILFEGRSVRFLEEAHEKLLEPLALFGPQKEEIPPLDWSYDAFADGPPEEKMPFLGEVAEFVPEERIEIHRVLSLAEDWHLADHTFVPARGVKPLWACMPVMPITMTLEAMAEVAQCLVPHLGFVGFADIRASRWVALEDASEATLRMRACRVEDEEGGVARVFCEVFVNDAKEPATKGFVLFADRYPCTLAPDFSDLGEPRAYDLTPAETYESGYLFHGPLYQVIEEVSATMDKGIVGMLSVAPKNRLFASTSTPVLLSEPIFLDAVGQLFGLWAIPQKKYIFPIHIERIEVYGPTPSGGSRLPVWIRVTDSAANTMAADMEIQDGEGGVWMRIKGWRDWVFRWPPHYYGIRRRPKKYLIASHLPVPGLQGVAFTLDGIGKLPRADVDFLARAYLGLEEYQKYLALSKNEKRQIEWLTARMAAKDAVRAWLARRGASEYLHPAAFSIENEESGAPRVEGVEEKVFVSLSHKGERAVAVASNEPVGIDLEPVEERSDAFARAFAHPEEKEILERVDGPWNWRVTALWCAKEASGKAFGTGLSPSPKTLVLEEVEEAFWRIRHPKGEARVILLDKDGLVVAVAVRAPQGESSARTA